MDFTPRIPEGRQVVTGYGDGRIRVSGKAWVQPVLVTPEVTLPWPVASMADVTAESLAPLLDHEPRLEILLFGCGRSLVPIPPALKALLREAGLSSDPMDTGAACRTYNVLVGEDRRVAAALLPV